MNFLTDEQLNKLTTKRLLGLFKSLRRFRPEWWDETEFPWDVPERMYKERVQKILNTREHVE